MQLLDLHERLASKSVEERQELMPGEFQVNLPRGTADCWPAAATAAIVITGSLSCIETDADIREALEQAERLLNGGIKTQDESREEIELVLGELMNWGALQEPEPTLSCPSHSG